MTDVYCFNQIAKILLRIQSVDGQDISPLFESPFDFEQEMLFCFVQFVGIGNCYNNMYSNALSFTHWNIDVNSHQFLSALISCVLKMFCKIVKDPYMRDT